MTTARLVIAQSLVGGEPGANAVQVEAGSIVAVGNAAMLRRNGLLEDRYEGAFLAPGLRDAHFHPVGYTAALERLVVKDAADFDSLRTMLRQAASQLEPDGTLVGIRMDDETLQEKRLPTRIDLDDMVSDRPLILYRYCGHIASVNTAALDLAGVNAGTADPPGGSLDRDSTGAPSGVLRETAIALVSDVVGNRVAGLHPDAVVRASQHMSAAGITAVGAMVTPGPGLWCDTAPELEVFLAAAPELALTMHTLVATTDPDELEAASQQIDRAGPYARFLGVKMFSDGSLGGHTAAMNEPFNDRPNELGTSRLGMGEALAAGRRSLALGGMVAIHAIGDRACGFVLDVFERLLDEGAKPSDLRIEHASVLAPDDISRIARLGIIASIQPAFLASEAGWIEKRLGPDRLPFTYPFRSLLDAGARLAGGSDCPVEPPHPLHGVASARDRGGLVPEESLSATESFDLFTSGAAAALRQPPPLAIGSPADLIVLDVDPTTATPTEVRNGEILTTYHSGVPTTHNPPGPSWNG